MKKFIYLCSFCSIITLNSVSLANDQTSVIDMNSITSGLNKNKSAAQRSTVSQIRRNLQFSTFGNDYTDFKNFLSNQYGLDFSFDISYMGQRGAPNGKNNAMQTIYYPSLTWTMMDNRYGTAILNAAYNSVKYGGISAEKLGNRLGTVTDINDYNDPSYSFDELFISYQLGGKYDWLTLAVGQFPLYNFDGTAYDSNQQVNFINYALSQNASSTYPTASLGSYVQIAPDDKWSFTFGAQDATNITGSSIKTDHFDEKHYTSFASFSYTPTISGLGSGQYSVMLYNQPAVKEQAETTNGWSFNLSQNFGEKLSLFARFNGVTGHTADINRSWVLGGVYNNPLDRNPLDQIGLAFAYNEIDEKAVGSTLAHESEKIIETYWAWGISKWMTITPDIQFYIDPADNPKSDYATVFSLRTTFFF
ncbi:MAG: carbohydrate porin [Alphaproteobacteria bacterium]|nr:carbohydrate porin [Alphaproteobacteria bacterium]